jgi:hypothetical protein
MSLPVTLSLRDTRQSPVALACVLLAFNFGVPTPSNSQVVTEGEAATLIGRVLAERGRDAAQRRIGRLLFEAGSMIRQREVAAAGRSQVIVNQPLPEGSVPSGRPSVRSEQLPIPDGTALTSDGRLQLRPGYIWANPFDPTDLRTQRSDALLVRWVDYNSDGSYQADELVRIQATFSSSEAFVVIPVVYLLADSGQSFRETAIVYGPQGQVALEYAIDPVTRRITAIEHLPGSAPMPSSGPWRGVSGLVLQYTPEYITTLLNRYGEGQWSAVFRRDGRIAATTAFTLMR